MDVQILEWINFLFRWLHVITAIAWVGASFYFVWLDLSLEEPPSWKKDQGVKGDLWAFHGGGIYEVAKYSLAPPKMPSTLHWFKWEAYATWITGTVLLIVMYYFNANLYLVDTSKWITSSEASILASIAFIASGVLVYNLLFHTLAINKVKLFSILLLIFIGFSCYLSVNLFSNRAAFLHVGAMIASIMAGSVYFGIIPAQKKFIVLLEENAEPNTEEMVKAQKRSLHNNYLTLPVLICMLSNHYPFLYGHSLNWLALFILMAASAYGRHYFNLKHQGRHKVSVLVGATAIALLVVIGMALANQIELKSSRSAEEKVHEKIQASEEETEQVSGSSDNEKVNKKVKKVTDSEEVIPSIVTIENIVNKHCSSCHSDKPTFAGINAPPLGLVFDNIEKIRAAKVKINTSLKTNYMPLGNLTQMTAQERQTLIENLEKL